MTDFLYSRGEAIDMMLEDAATWTLTSGAEGRVCARNLYNAARRLAATRQDITAGWPTYDRWRTWLWQATAGVES